jgi:hypothetical protein
MLQHTAGQRPQARHAAAPDGGRGVVSCDLGIESIIWHDEQPAADVLPIVGPGG